MEVLPEVVTPLPAALPALKLPRPLPAPRVSAFSRDARARAGFSRTVRSRGVSHSGLRPRPNAPFAQPRVSRHWNPQSHGKLMKNTTAAPAPTLSAAGVLTTPACPPRPSSSARPRWSTSTANANEWNNAASSEQLARSTQKKPSQSRIVPGPRRPPPLGRTDLTMRQRRGMNQTAEAPNQPKTTVCMQGTRNDVSDVSCEPRLRQR